MGKFKLIQKGFKYLKQGGGAPSFLGIVNKNEIPKWAVFHYNSPEFNHEYWDYESWDVKKSSSWLPFVYGKYMHFEVTYTDKD